MRKFINKSLQLKLITSFSILSLVTVSVVALGTYQLAKNAIKESVFQKLKVAASIKEDQIEQWFENQYRDTLLSASLPEIRQQSQILFESESPEEERKLAYQELDRYFSSVKEIKSTIREISLVTNNGIVILSTNKDLEGKYQPLGQTNTYLTRDSVLEEGKKIQPTFYTSAITGKQQISLATPILERNSQRIGAILITLNLNEIDDLIRQRAGLGQTGVTYLVGRLEERNAFISSSLVELEQLQEYATTGIDSYAIRAATSGRNGSGVYYNYDGVEVVGVYRWLENQNLALIAEIEKQEAYAPAGKLANSIFAIGLGASGLLILGVYFLSYQITKPILTLTHAATKVAKGDLSYRASVSREDEIGVLTVAFNQMGQQLQKSFTDLEKVNQDLENRVKERTAELEEAKEIAETANQSKDKFLLNISHELRSPLNSIIGYAKLLLEERNMRPQRVLGLRIIQQSGQHLLGLINDILDFSKIEANKMQLSLTSLHFPSFIEGIIGMIEMQAKQKRIAFEYEKFGNLPVVIKADEYRLRQILLNLLTNAIKFTDKGKVIFRITVIDSRFKTKLRFEVIDTGVGISHKQVEKIFEPFEQAGDKDRRTSGTGLGLPISRQLAELMGSTIQVKSKLSKGSTFWFDASFNIVATVSASNQLKLKKPRIIGYKGFERRILIVDDIVENRLLLLDLLEPKGFKVIEAENGYQGLDIARSQLPHLILTDLLMPVKTGITMVMDLRKIPELESTPIIAVSASNLEIMSKKSSRIGCNSFLPKPIDQDKLLEYIQEYLHLEWIYDLDNTRIS